MTARTYQHAEIVFPNGERHRVTNVRISLLDERATSIVYPSTCTIASGTMPLSKRGWRHLTHPFPWICWKCFDVRTRGHNRRCKRRGGGRRRER